MMALNISYQEEDQLVAELTELGVSYLSHEGGTYAHPRPVDMLLAGLILQPSSRVRVALIALLLAKPGYAAFVPEALKQLNAENAQILKLFYSAAVALQEKHTALLRKFQGTDWQSLPDLFGTELGIEGETPQARLRQLAQLHAEQTGIRLNWLGTYENAARHLLRRWELESQWNR